MTCTSSLEDLIEGYSHYAPLWDSDCDHILEGVRSQMKPAGWRSMLSGGPTNMYGVDTWDFDSHFLLHGMLHGFKLVDPDSPIDPYSTKNYGKSDALDFIDNLIEEELAAGKLSVVSEKLRLILLPIHNHCLSILNHGMQYNLGANPWS